MQQFSAHLGLLLILVSLDLSPRVLKLKGREECKKEREIRESFQFSKAVAKVHTGMRASAHQISIFSNGLIKVLLPKVLFSMPLIQLQMIENRHARHCSNHEEQLEINVLLKDTWDT